MDTTEEHKTPPVPHCLAVKLEERLRFEPFPFTKGGVVIDTRPRVTEKVIEIRAVFVRDTACGASQGC
jgi:hypothetical protein